MKKFIKFLLKSISNERGEIDLGGNQGEQSGVQESMIVPGGGSTPPIGGEPGGTPALDQSGQPQQPVFNPSEWNLNYKGQPIAVRDRNHLVTLATKGYGFDQEVNRLKQRETELNELGTKYQKYGQLEEALSKNPELAQRLFQMVQNPQNGVGEFEEEPAYVQELRNQVQGLSEWKSSWENRMADQDLDKEMKELKKDFSQHDWSFDDGSGTLEQKILRHAHNNGNQFPSLRAAYRDFFWDNRDATIKADTLKAEQERIAREKAKGKVGAGGNNPPPAPKPSYSSDKSYNDLANIAMQRLTK